MQSDVPEVGIQVLNTCYMKFMLQSFKIIWIWILMPCILQGGYQQSKTVFSV